MSASDSNAMLDATLEYAHQGWHVFPVHGIRDGQCTCGVADCRDAGKHPRIKGWPTAATTDPNQIMQWWRQWPDANIGAACGPSGILVLDTDPRNGGDSSYSKLVELHGEIVAPTAATGGGGKHRFFSKPQGSNITAKSLGDDYPGIDIKADGGYVLLPPSMHRSGQRYKWEVPTTIPALDAFPQPPEWLIDQLRHKHNRGNGIAGASAIRPSAISNGHRNKSAFDIACTLARQNLNEQALFAELSVMRNNGLFEDSADDPLDDAEIARIAASAIRTVTQTAAAAGSADPPLLTMADLLTGPIDPEQWLVDGMLPDGGTSLLAAKPKVGKSTLAQDLAFCVARGENFLSRAGRKGPVLYLALEGRRGELRRAFTAMGAVPDDPILFHVARTPKDAIAWLERTVLKVRPVLIIVDTFQRFARLKDLNDYALVTNALDPLTHLARESSSHLMLVHHAKKSGGTDGDAVLGSTGLFGAVDTLLEMRRRNDVRSLSTIQRYGEDLEPTIIALNPTTYRLSARGSAVDADHKRVEAAMLEHVAATTEAETRNEVFGAVEGRTTVKVAVLKALVDSGKVIRTGGGKRSNPFRYSCSPVPTS
jgi:hypothetical protein